jgi:hypothetical protein
MNSTTGEIWPTLKEALDEGQPAEDMVEIRGEEAAIQRISKTVKDQRRMKDKAAKASRKKNRK